MRVLIDDGTSFSTLINNKLDWLISPLSGLCWNNCDYYKMVLYDSWIEISCNIYVSRHSGVIVRSKKILGSVPEWGGTFGVEFVFFILSFCLGTVTPRIWFPGAVQLLPIAPQKRMDQMQETNFTLRCNVIHIKNNDS